MKKIAFFGSAVALALFGACSAQKPADTSAAGRDEKVTLTVWGPETVGNDYNTIMNTVEYEKKTGVHINWNLFSSSLNANEAFNLLIAGGDLPDIICRWFSPEEIRMCIEGNILTPLDDYIAKDSYYKKALEEQPQYRSMITAPDDHIYSFIYTDSGVHKDSEYKMWVKTDWLTKLGISEPTTPQEFKDMLIAFRDRDPNGNGKKDELTLVGWVNGRQANPINYLMNPFQLYRENYYYITDAGVLEFIANTDGWREGLRYLNDLYRNGLIMDETYVQDETQFKSLLNRPADEAIVGVFPAWFQGAYIDINVLNWTDYQAIAPLKGPTGLQQSAARKGGNFNLNNGITTACKNPEAAFKWLDWMLGDEGLVFGHYGAAGISYTMSDKPAWNGRIPSYVLDPGFNKLGTTMMVWNSGFFPRYDKAEVRYGTTADDTKRNVDNTYVLLSAAQIYEPYYVWHNIPDVVWCNDEDVITARTDYQTEFNNYINAECTEFVRGTKNINDNAVWEAYKTGLNNLGLSGYMDTLRKYYNVK
ncbi:MAG: extracellular solute-binding protein [Treponema sp.]|jgi:putative aldouronate transport system substrate-binding protein|nr:extracellular solute-binding protein [Treponema sp.]